MGLLTAQQARMPMRTSYPGRSSLSGRKDKHVDPWSSRKTILPLLLLVITVVAVTGILKTERLSQHMASISMPVLHRVSHSHSSSSSSSSHSHIQVPATTSDAATNAPADIANTAAEPEVIAVSAGLYEEDGEAEDDGREIQPPEFQSLSLSSSSAASKPSQHDSSSSPQQPDSAARISEFQTLSLGSVNSNINSNNQQQQQQPLQLGRPAAARSAAAAAAGAAFAGGAASKPPVSRAPNKRNRLMLATHSRLMWYYPDTDEHQILHEGEGVHYGMFPGAGSRPISVWTAIRPHNWRPSSNREFLVELDMETGAELQRVQIPSRFTHDVVRSGDSVYVCDTGNGRILQLAFPDMTPVRSMELFSLRDHPNTLAPLAPDNFLVVLHNLGNSDVVRVNVSAIPTIANPAAWLADQHALLAAASPTDNEVIPITKPQQPEGAGNPILGRVQKVGQKAHGLIPWQGAYIMLDSDNGALMALDLTGAATGEGFKLVQLWKTPERGTFLKGLTVVDDVAYFGISPWAPRSARDDPKSNNELAAFDLISGQLLWRREVPTAGLLNIVGAPHLSEGSTYLPSYTGKHESDAVRKHHTSPEVAVAMKSLKELGYPPVVGGYWSSGLPYLDTTIKATKRPWEAGLQLPLLMLNISDLQAAVAALPSEAWTYDYQAKYSAVMAGREGNQVAFKPGVEGIVLLFSANDGSGPVYKFPAYDYFAPVLEPLLEEILGKRDVQHIIRLQLALMKPGVSDIKIHVDSGGYAIKGHRLHIPIFTHPEVSFDVCPHRYVPDPSHVLASPDEPQRLLDIQECFKIPTIEGFVFELNNRAAHKVSNLSPVERVHLVFDLCEEPHPRVEVPVGTVCDYDMEKGLLCKYPDGQSPAVQLPPAQWLDPEAASAEGYGPGAATAAGGAQSGQQQQQQQQQAQYEASLDMTGAAAAAAAEAANAAAAGEEDDVDDAGSGEDDSRDGEWLAAEMLVPVDDPGALMSSVLEDESDMAAAAALGAAEALAGTSVSVLAEHERWDDQDDGDDDDDVRAPVPVDFQLGLGRQSGGAVSGAGGVFLAGSEGLGGFSADSELEQQLLLLGGGRGQQMLLGGPAAAGSGIAAVRR